MPRYQVTRRRWGVLIGTAVAAVVGTGVAVLGSGGGSPDTSAPSLFLSAPADGATVSGSTVTVSATCGDNVGCAGVQFRLDGANLAAEDTSAPFSISWDSTTANSGTHTLAAVARDAAGNATTSASETVTVSGGAGSPPVGNVFLSATGSDAGSNCKRFTVAQAAPADLTSVCLSFNKAALLASSGDLVSVAAGTYSADQKFTETNTNAYASRVDFSGPTPNSSVAVTGIIDTWGASHLEFDHMTFSGGTSTRAAFNSCWNGTGGPVTLPSVSNDIVLNDVHVTGQFAGVSGCATNWAIKNSEIGPMGGLCSGGTVNCAANSSPVFQPQELYYGSGNPKALASDVHGFALTNSSVHDIGVANTNDHQQCIELNGVQGYTLKQDSFYNCEGNQGIFMQGGCFSSCPNEGSGTGTYLPFGTIENVVVGNICNNQANGQGCPANTSGSACISVNDGGGVHSLNGPWVAAYVSCPGGSFAPATIGTIKEAGVAAPLAVGNIFNNGTTCHSNVTYVKNVQVTAETLCGTDTATAQTRAQMYTNWGASPPDVSLLAGAAALGAGDTEADYPISVDLAGSARPCGGANPDAGAVESCGG